MLYDPQEIDSVVSFHQPTNKIRDKIAYGMIKGTRYAFDKLSGYDP